MEKLRSIVPQYLAPGAVIPFRKSNLAPRTEVLTNPTPEQEAAVLEPIKGMKVGLVGFGSQSSNQARCLRYEGIGVGIIGRDPNSASMKAAAADGFEVFSIQNMLTFDIICIGIPDDQQVRELPAFLASLPNRPVLMFYHGMSVHYGVQEFYGPELQRALLGWNIGIVAPKGPGPTVWRNKQADGGIACLYGALETSPQRYDTDKLAKAYCAALGGLRGAALNTTFKEETETDHFGEQGVLCGVLLEAYWFVVRRLQECFGLSLEQAQTIVEREFVLFGDMIRRGGAGYVLSSVTRPVLESMKKFAGEFYGVDIGSSDLLDEELEKVGAELRALQPHLSPVTSMGRPVCGKLLRLPRPITDYMMGGVSGILLAASTWQYRIGRLAGYTSEGLQFEVQQEIPLITDCIRFGGMSYMCLRISTTAKHGMFVSGRFIAKSMGMKLDERFGTVLGAIQNGEYARRTKLDLVDIERGGEGDWLWPATKSVIESPEEAASAARRPASCTDFKGDARPGVFVKLGGRPWEYSFHNKSGELIAA